MAKKEILLGVTGSIAAYKACDITNRLRELKYNVTCVMTEEAKYFISPLTLQHLSGNRVITEMFAPLDLKRGLTGFALPENHDPLHTALADKADLILIAPATANIIGKIANGICDDILSCTILAAKAPVLIAPAMNDKMYKHKSVKENITRLKSWGYKFIGPEIGRLVCGYREIGHISETETILKEVKRALR
ncbi:MAG: hypothetical protein ISS34_02050 [Candidatus Omnitrophica bacterium]|nr:hypothetical protein [Candidatus Omnitrophota bacterium]